MLDCLLLSGAAVCAAELKQAGDEPKPRTASRLHVSAELAVVSDYRFGGVTQSKGDPALQGRVTIRHDSGWSAGAFATSMQSRRGSNAQIVLFGERRFAFGEAEFSLGASAVVFFGGDADPFAVARASVSHPVGPVDATLTVSYGPPQPALNDEDGANINLRVRSLLGRLNGAPLTAAASLGRSEGDFAMGAETKLDWSLGVSTEVGGLEYGLAYVDNDLDDHRGEAGLVFSVAHEF